VSNRFTSAMTASMPTSPAGRSHEATRAELTALERHAERERQTALHEKHTELNRLANKEDEHRRQVDKALNAKKQLLDDVRSVRDKMHSNFRVAKAKGAHDFGVADRALARAGQVALSARGDAERWHAAADAREQLQRTVGARTEDSLARMQEGSAVRVAEARAHGEDRAETGLRLTEEFASNQDQLRQRAFEHLDTEERGAQQLAFQKMTSAQLARRDADMKVRAAMDKSARDQLQAMDDVQKSRRDAEERVQEAKQKLAEKRWECEAALHRERVCNAQAKNIAAAMKDAQEAEREVNLNRLDEKVFTVTSHEEKRVTLAQELIPVAEERNEAWLSRMSCDVAAAHARAEDEEVDAMQRVSAAKVTLKTLQAECAAYIRDLLEQWEEAKRAGVAKVKAAKEKTEELERYCQETLQKNERQLSEMIKNTAEFAETKQAYLEERAQAIEDMSKSRVAMMQQQSYERRKQAEKRLMHLEEHIEDVRKRCDQRVRAEDATAVEKVRIARERFEAYVQRLELRTKEAEHARDQASVAYAAVAARSHGAAMEARRRGLDNIAAVIGLLPLAAIELGDSGGTDSHAPPELRVSGGAGSAALSDVVFTVGGMRDEDLRNTKTSLRPSTLPALAQQAAVG